MVEPPDKNPFKGWLHILPANDTDRCSEYYYRASDLTQTSVKLYIKRYLRKYYPNANLTLD